MKELATTFLTLLLSLNAFSSEKEIISLEKTPQKLINNEKMVSDVAEAYIKNIYGKDVSENEKPYLIKNENEYWIVSGSLQKNIAGGVFTIKIRKDTGAIDTFTHGE
ncbi:NTF2 fold immunity protein [Obesumbacterium proteus]|uniref:NTF2 fold immunity protein n=1 Tax=Obesumbacterium proteus TaxID=82983 RepID=UPI001F2F7DC3|nr:NTF2 fold immunity protein [Obesumbacterium proteus]MCE9883906.1 YbbC/YhhH family protein [Obesumbacterium proteus]MCE9918200.1 YbbC/YhhH family protein [Obesumbacterium proteus]MCE9931445.1 YbbC/YhhH family protein [Obesumbacterium proteus]